MAKLLKIGAEYIPNYVVTLPDGTVPLVMEVLVYFIVGLVEVTDTTLLKLLVPVKVLLPEIV